MPHTIRLHRVLRAPAERLYRAFIDPDAMVKWMPPHGFSGHIHHMDARVGGAYKMSFSNLGTGTSHHFGGAFVELVPGERLVYSDAFDDPGLPGQMRTTVSLRAGPMGTDLHITQDGVPDAIPVQACYLGWQESLELLARLVEAQVPDLM